MASPYLEISRTAREIRAGFALLWMRARLSTDELAELRTFLARERNAGAPTP